MSTGYSVTTAKGEFALVREFFPGTDVSICLPDFLKDICEDELQSVLPLSQQPIIAKADKRQKIVFIAKVFAGTMELSA